MVRPLEIRERLTGASSTWKRRPPHSQADVEGYSITVCIGQSMPVTRRIGELCRAAGVKFVAGRCHGTLGWYFLDLLTHEYVTESKVQGQTDRLVRRARRGVGDGLRPAFLGGEGGLPGAQSGAGRRTPLFASPAGD